MTTTSLKMERAPLSTILKKSETKLNYLNFKPRWRRGKRADEPRLARCVLVTAILKKAENTLKKCADGLMRLSPEKPADGGSTSTTATTSENGAGNTTGNGVGSNVPTLQYDDVYYDDEDVDADDGRTKSSKNRQRRLRRHPRLVDDRDVDDDDDDDENDDVDDDDDEKLKRTVSRPSIFNGRFSFRRIGEPLRLRKLCRQTNIEDEEEENEEKEMEEGEEDKSSSASDAGLDLTVDSTTANGADFLPPGVAVVQPEAPESTSTRTPNDAGAGYIDVESTDGAEKGRNDAANERQEAVDALDFSSWLMINAGDESDCNHIFGGGVANNSYSSANGVNAMAAFDADAWAQAAWYAAFTHNVSENVSAHLDGGSGGSSSGGFAAFPDFTPSVSSRPSNASPFGVTSRNPTSDDRRFQSNVVSSSSNANDDADSTTHPVVTPKESTSLLRTSDDTDVPTAIAAPEDLTFRRPDATSGSPPKFDDDDDDDSDSISKSIDELFRQAEELLDDGDSCPTKSDSLSAISVCSTPSPLSSSPSSSTSSSSATTSAATPTCLSSSSLSSSPNFVVTTETDFGVKRRRLENVIHQICSQPTTMTTNTTTMSTTTTTTIATDAIKNDDDNDENRFDNAHSINNNYVGGYASPGVDATQKRVGFDVGALCLAFDESDVGGLKRKLA